MLLGNTTANEATGGGGRDSRRRMPGSVTTAPTSTARSCIQRCYGVAPRRGRWRVHRAARMATILQDPVSAQRLAVVLDPHRRGFGGVQGVEAEQVGQSAVVHRDGPGDLEEPDQLEAVQALVPNPTKKEAHLQVLATRAGYQRALARTDAALLDAKWLIELDRAIRFSQLKPAGVGGCRPSVCGGVG
jgi:hypothetical protein